MAQWLRIRLPMEETKWIPGPGGFHMPQSSYARVPQLLGPGATTTEACAPGACAPQQEKPPVRSPRTSMKKQPPPTTTTEILCATMKTQHNQK